MEDQVPFKVFTFWRDGSAQPEVRRFGVDKNVVTSFSYLQAKIQEVYPKLKEETFSISWKDEDGDEVKMSTDEEVMTMLTALRESVVKLFVHVDEPASTSRPKLDGQIINVAVSANPLPLGQRSLHVGVCCDGCGRDVVGFRYKCVACEDFDLCSQCEGLRVHPNHCLVRIPSPLITPHALKDNIKKTRSVLKNIAQEQRKRSMEDILERACTGAYPFGKGSVLPPQIGADWVPKPVPKHAAAKERREERREERQEKRQAAREERQGRREERQEERREKRDTNPRQPRRGWMDVVTKYMDQFANLAADHIRVAGSVSADGADQTNARLAQQTAEELLLTNQLDLNPTELEQVMNACMNARETDECPLVVLNREVKRLFESIAPQEASTAPQEATTAPQAPADPQGSANSLDPQSPPAAPATPQVPATQQAPTAQQTPIAPQVLISQRPALPTPTTPPATPTPVKPEGDCLTKSDVSSTSSGEFETGNREGSIDKAEDWTMINKDKDFDADNSAAAAAEDGNLPVGFQLRLRAPHAQIYPPLNTATADTSGVPAQTVPAPAAAAAAGPPIWAPYAANTTEHRGHAASASAASAAATTSVPRPSAPVPEQRHHEVPHIDAAIRQMIAMGFTNEGGWLTQLLESKDGNIAAVLDLLTPVNPHRK